MTHKGVLVGLDNEKLEATFKFTDYSVLKKLETLVDVPIGVTIKKWREERTLAQNNFLWACIGDIARVTQNNDRWQIYLELLKRYGKFTYILIDPKAVDRFKKDWRECEDLGEVKTESGRIARQLRVYYGSHLYTTDEMCTLLNGVLDEMKALNIKPKLSKEEMERYGLNN